MGYVIIKLYVNELQGDFHDINISNFESIVKEMQDYAAKSNKKLFFAALANDESVGIPVSCTPFAEIEYTDSITVEEKHQYVDYLKKLSANAKLNGIYLEESNTLTMVKFRKIEDEIFEIS